MRGPVITKEADCQSRSSNYFSRNAPVMPPKASWGAFVFRTANSPGTLAGQANVKHRGTEILRDSGAPGEAWLIYSNERS